MNPCGYHATNVLIHLANGLLVAVLIRQLTGSGFIAWFTAALFLVHPIQIETVAWISSRKGLLSATFMLAALIVRLRPDVQPKHDGWFVVWLAAALMSKALAVVLPPIVLAYDLWVRRQKFSDAFVRQIIPGVMCLLLLLKTMASQNSIMGGLRGHLELSTLHIIAIDTTILWRYIGMLFRPSDLCVLYDPPTTGIWFMVLTATIAWGLVAAAAWKLRHRYPLVLWSMVSFLLLLMPVLNLFRITTLMNDRYLYLPCISIFALTAGGLNWLLRKGEKHSEVIVQWLTGSFKWGVTALVICAAVVATRQHLPVWQNPFTLWNHAMSRVPQLAVVRIQMAYTLHDSGQRREGLRELQRALLECEPDALDRQRIRDTIRNWTQELDQLQTADGQKTNRR